MKDYIKSGSIHIRKASFQDASAMFILIDKNRERLAQVFPWTHSISSVSKQESFYLQVDQLWQSKREYHFVLTYDGVHVGALSVHSVKWDQGEAQFGYWIDKQYEGRGIISNSILEVEKELRSMGLNRIVIRFHKDNKRSQRVAEILGFQGDKSVSVEGNIQALVKKA